MRELRQLNNCRFAVSYALHWGKAKYFFLQREQRIQEFMALPRNTASTQSDLPAGAQRKPAGDREIMERLARIWGDSSLMMNQLLSARKIPYFHFIHPNQYYKTEKHFSDEEAKLALASAALYSQPVSIGYRLILGRVGELRAAGIRIFSGVNVFDPFDEPVYDDACCHYNKRGSHIFGNYIAETVAVTLKAEMENSGSGKPK